MSRLLCCLRARQADMGGALSHPQEGEACEASGLPAAPPTMADVIRERKKKAGGAGLGTLRRRIANAARRPRDNRPDRDCEHARFIRSVVSSWRLAEVFLLCAELEAGCALRDLATQADLAREPARDLATALPTVYTDRWWCDVELVGAGWSIPAHRAILAARSTYFRDLLQRYPPSCTRVPLEGACASIPREEADACIYSLYAGGTPSRRTHCRRHNKYDSNERTDGDLDLVDNTNLHACVATSVCTCSLGRGEWRRSATLLGVTRDPLHTSMRYLLDSGEMCDTKLVFYSEGGGGGGLTYGFRTSLELPVHRAVLAARSRFFRSVMSRRGSSGGSGGSGGSSVCVDEKVLPRRFARALLHAAYTDQVDLSLILSSRAAPRDNTSGTAWPGMARSTAGGSRLTIAMLDDAFQLYEIARFLEMPIVVQGCEDAIAEALSPDTLAHVLRWARAPHASQWVHRQAMRYLRDEFASIAASPGAACVPRSALCAALASPFLQCSEPAALRALLRWAADHKHKHREPNVVWHTAHSVSRRGARRRELGDAALREILAPLVSHVRIEHIPHDNELLAQLVRRGLVPTPPGGSGGPSAWLGRGDCRPARCFLPYLDEIKALLEDQAVPEEEVARARRARYMQRIPDTLYMVAAGRNPSPCPSEGESSGTRVAARACVPSRVLRVLRARVRELRAAPSARTAARDPTHAPQVHKQIALRAVREMSLPDACADLLLNDIDDESDQNPGEAWDSPRPERHRSEEPDGYHRDWPDNEQGNECCRTSGGGSVRCASAGSARSPAPRAAPLESSRGGTCRRELPARTEGAHHRNSSGDWCVGGRLSAAVPDVAMAPNANTHLLTHRDYFRHPYWEYGGVVLQLDLGDGATHTPRPGSRAQRNSAAAQQNSTRQRDHPQVSQAISCLRARSDEDELRAAIELSVMRAYSSFHTRAGGDAAGAGAGASVAAAPQPHRSRAAAATLPHAYRSDTSRHAQGASPRPSAPAASRADPLHHLAVGGAGPPSPCPSPRRRDLGPRHHDYRVEGGPYAGSASTSRGHSPNNYA